MIVVTDRNTCRAAYIPEKDIMDMDERSEDIDGRAYPYTRIHVKSEKDKTDYYIDAVESKKKINSLIFDAKNREGRPHD